MKTKSVLIIFTLLVVCMPSGCDKDKHYPVQGRVIDAVTRQPVEGAVVAVNWVRYKFSPPGLGTNKERYGTSESITDTQGQFVIPNYVHGSCFMGIYKQGYVCWSSKKVYNPKGRTYEEKYKRRKGFRVEDGMVIELQPIEKEGFPVLEHARFVMLVNDKFDVDNLFTAAIKGEYEIYRKGVMNK